MKSKKILLGSLSTIALVATPIAAVVSCDKHVAAKPVAKVSTEAKITKTKATGFVINFNGKQFVTAEQAKAGGSVVLIYKGKPTTISWDKKLEAGTKVSFKTLLKGEEITTTEGNELTPTQADDKHFVLREKGTSTGEYKTLAEVKSGFGGFVSLYDGKPASGVKLLFDKKTNAVTTEGIKIFNDLLKETGLVVASATVTIIPAVPASVSSSSVTSTGTPSQTQVSITWGSKKPVATNTDAADVAAVKALLVTNAITPAVATDAVAAITTATPITDLASLNTATPNIVFSATGTLPTGAALKGVSIKIKSLSALAASGSVHGNLVIELSKGQATDTITIAVVGKA